MIAAVSQAPQPSNLSAERIVAFELLGQEQVFLEFFLEWSFSIIIYPQVQWGPCIFLYWMKPSLQWDPGICQNTNGCSRIKDIPTINWCCKFSLFLQDLNGEVVEYKFQFMSNCRANKISTSIEPAQQESKLIAVCRQELEIIDVVVKGPYNTCFNLTRCGLLCETKHAFSTLQQPVSHLWVYKKFYLEDPPLTSLFSIAMQSRECYALVKQRKIQKLKQLDRCWSSMIWIISFMPP